MVHFKWRHFKTFANKMDKFFSKKCILGFKEQMINISNVFKSSGSIEIQKCSKAGKCLQIKLKCHEMKNVTSGLVKSDLLEGKS